MWRGRSSRAGGPKISVMPSTGCWALVGRRSWRSSTRALAMRFAWRTMREASRCWRTRVRLARAADCWSFERWDWTGWKCGTRVTMPKRSRDSARWPSSWILFPAADPTGMAPWKGRERSAACTCPRNGWCGRRHACGPRASASREVASADRGAGRRLMDLRGRVALVTGGAVRVGRALALALAEGGARVAIHYHASAAEARTAVRDAQAVGADAWAVQADLGRPDAPDALVDAVAAHFGALDVLVNSADIMWRTPLSEITVEQWDAMFALNLRAPFFCARAAARVMGERGGVIVNIADL